jgi:hypothetical protein
VLEEFVTDNGELQRLEILLRKFNLFEALNLVWHEVRHSDFLAYLLDPQQNHGLGDAFLKAFLARALKGGAGMEVTRINIDVWTLTAAAVHREWQNIDLFVRDEANRLAVVIENKIRSTEHSNQLVKYLDCVSQECTGWKIIPIYLTVEGDVPSDERWIPFGYDEVCNAIERLVKLRRAMLDNDLRVTLEHYVEMLRRHIVADSQIAEICRQLYAKHKEALDLIYEHRPDRLQTVRDFIEGWVKTTSDYELDHCSKSYIRFIPKSIDTETLRQGSYVASKRMLLFEAKNVADRLNIQLVIHPGPAEIRQKLFDMAQSKKPPFNTTTKLYPQWTTIFTQKILSAKDYELPDDEFRAALEKHWNQFVDKALPQILVAIEDEKWIHGSTAR